MAQKTTARRPGGARPGPQVRQRSRARGSAGRLPVIGVLAALLIVAGVGLALFWPKGPETGYGPPLSVLKAPDYHALAFSLDDPNVVFFGYHNGIKRSTDGGRTWSDVVAQTNFDAMNMAINRANPRQMYMAGHEIFQASTDGGGSWQPVPNNLPDRDIHAFAMNPDDPRQLHAFVVDHGVFQSSDGGQTWQPLGGTLPQDVLALASAGGTPETLYVGSIGSGLLRSTDGGQQWALVTQGLSAGGVRTVAVDPTTRKTLYAGQEDGLYKSTDGGASWSKLPFPGQKVTIVAISPAQPRVVLALAVNGRDGLVYRSEDGGASWNSR